MNVPGKLPAGRRAIGIIVACFAAGGCGEPGGPGGGAKPQSQPAPTYAAPAAPKPATPSSAAPISAAKPAPESSAAPSASETGAQEASAAPSAQAAEPDLPEYLRILDRYDNAKPSSVQANLAGRRLVIDTRNVKALRIERRMLDVPANQSIALQLDGQGIEWTAGSEVVLFERSPNGVWTPARKPTSP